MIARSSSSLETTCLNIRPALSSSYVWRGCRRPGTPVVCLLSTILFPTEDRASLGLRPRPGDGLSHGRNREAAPGAPATLFWPERALLGQSESARLKQVGDSVARWR